MPGAASEQRRSRLSRSTHPSFYVVASEPDRLYATYHASYEDGIIESHVVGMARYFAGACVYGARTTTSSRAKVLKLADKTSNLRAITASPPPDWSVKRRVEYVTWAREVVAGLRGVNDWLEVEFDKAASAAEESVRP
jgi:hypothetical protein